MLIRLESGVIINSDHIVRIYRWGAVRGKDNITISFINGDEEEVTVSDIKNIVGAQNPPKSFTELLDRLRI